MILDRVDQIAKGWGHGEAIFRSEFAGGGGTTGMIDPATNCVGSDNAYLRFSDASREDVAGSEVPRHIEASALMGT
jgi:hypothetical protein